MTAETINSVYQWQQFALSLTRDKYLCQDLLHDVFVRLLTCKSMVPQDQTELQRFIPTVIKNCFFDNLRKERKFDAVDLSILKQTLSDILPSDYASKCELQYVLRILKAEANNVQFAALLLQAEGYSIKEICKAQGGANQNAVLARIYKAKIKLKKLMIRMEQ